MWFFECVLFNSLYLSIDHWHALPCYVPLIHLCCSLEWKEITKEFPCLSEFLCICGLFSLLISSMYMILLKILNTNFFFFLLTTNKNKTAVAGVVSHLAEVQLPGVWPHLVPSAGLRRQKWYGSVLTNCHDHSYLILNILILIYFYT